MLLHLITPIAGLLEALRGPPATFTRNVQAIVQLCRSKGCRTVLGGLYPNDFYSPDSYAVLVFAPFSVPKNGSQGAFEADLRTNWSAAVEVISTLKTCVGRIQR